MSKLPAPFPLPLSRKWQENGHSGIDWSRAAGAGLGAAIRASGTGTVTFDGFNNSRSGYVTTVTYDNGVMAMYCHRQAGSGLKKGTRVSEGTIVAYVGYTGNVVPSGPGGAHLHLEVYVGGRLVNPGDYFDLNRVVGTGGGGGGGGGGGIEFNHHDLWVQRALNQLGYGPLDEDGKRGAATIAAVKRLQADGGLAQDGIPGNATTEYIKRRLNTPAPAPSGRPVIRRGSTGSHVSDVQRQLKNNYPLYAGKLSVDGIFGPALEAAVKEFQRRSGLTADGIVGTQTWKALGLA